MRANVNRVSKNMGDFESRELKSLFKKVKEGKETKVVSFYDEDGEFYFSLRIAICDYFEYRVSDFVDVLEGYYGITNAKYDGKFLF